MLKIAIIRNNISYIQFHRALAPFRVFSLNDARKAFPGFDSKRLVEWQEKGYIKKIINKWYIFSGIPLSEPLAYRISNCLHRPSYISLESALSYYNLIPEMVYNHQAVCTRKTITYTTPVGTFNYRSVKPGLFFGYSIIQAEGLPALLAEPEKALLDLLYLNSSLRSVADMLALRFNVYEINHTVKWEKLLHYAGIFHSAALDKRVSVLKKILSDAHID